MSNNQNAYEPLINGKSAPLSDKLNISLIKQEDFNEIVKMLNTDRVNKYLFYAPSPPEVFEMFFNPMIEDTKQALSDKKWPNSAGLVIRDSSHNFVGNAGMSQNPFLSGNYEMGFHLAESSWRKGIATLIAEFITELAFNHLQAYKLSADCYAQNLGSVKVLEKAGFSQEGCLIDYYNNEDDKLIFGITKQQFSDLL